MAESVESRAVLGPDGACTSEMRRAEMQKTVAMNIGLELLRRGLLAFSVEECLGWNIYVDGSDEPVGRYPINCLVGEVYAEEVV